MAVNEGVGFDDLMVGYWRGRPWWWVSLTLSVLAAVLTTLGALAVNAVSAVSGPWPWGLELIRRYPLWSILVVTVVSAAVAWGWARWHQRLELADDVAMAASAPLVVTRVWPGRAVYAEQVRDIVPSGGLAGRDEELAELAGFCAGDEPYVWWQAGPWAGKSALLAWFASGQGMIRVGGHLAPGWRTAEFRVDGHEGCLMAPDM